MWLRLQRGQCGLTHANVAAWLGISRSDVKLVEERRWPLPVEWFPSLDELFAPRRGKRERLAAPKKESATQKDPASQSDSASQNPTQSVPSQSARELTETIMNYRLMLGERSGLSAIEVLAQITADFQFALAEDALSYDQLHAAIKLINGR